MNIRSIQNFNLHAHHGGFGCYNGQRTGNDGHNNAVRMLKTARLRGFETYGLVAHLDFNRHFKFEGMKKYEGMSQFNDLGQAIDSYNKSAVAVRSAVKQVPGINGLVGFEVDFYRGDDWWHDFDIIRDNIDFDFLIGSTHSVSNEDGTKSRNMYWMNQKDFSLKAIDNYYQNVKACISSGLFDFVAHIDLIRYFVPNCTQKFTETMDEIIELLVKYNLSTEINTSGFRKNLAEAFPEQSTLSKLAKNNVPVFISDDAHDIKSVGSNFHVAADCLRRVNIPQYSLSDVLNRRQR